MLSAVLRARVIRAAGVLAALVLWAGPVGGQDEPGPAPAEESAPLIRDEVELSVAKLGPGNRTRAGDWGGVLVEFRDSSLEQREILLRLTGHDRDGDPPYFERVVVSDPERARTAWLYAKLPYSDNASRVSVTAHEAIEDPGAGEGQIGFRPGRVLGRTWLDMSRLVRPESGLIGVIGTQDFGLRQYSVSIEAGSLWLPLGHEHTEVASGLGIDDIPDRWQGLASYETIVWGRGGEADPGALGPERARALIEWTRRGGHFIVVLPPVGQEWLVPARNPLSPILPAMRVERREGASLEPYRPMLTLSEDATLPGEAVVQVMTPAPDAGRLEAMPVLAGPDGAAVVMRRVFGAGMVSVVGLDLGVGSLAATGRLDAEAFWHRVLGRRHSLERFEEVEARDRDLASAIQQRAMADYDADLEQEIDRKGDASEGVLLSLAVFVVYWLLAGPLGYHLLSRNGLKAHAWLGFMAATGVFTALAWLGATVLRPDRVEGDHVGFLDEVHGTGFQRSRMWMSILVPEYGEATIAVGEQDPEAGEDLISAWVPPPPGGAGQGFPDNRGYRIPARRPDSMTVPVRSTIKQVRVEWGGPERWSMPEPAREPGSLEEARLVLADPDEAVVEGVLVHDLPGALEDVLVVTVTGQRELQPGVRISPLWMPARAYMDKPTIGRWEPGQRLDLGQVTGGGQRSASERSALGWFTREAEIGQGRSFAAEGPMRRGDVVDRLTAISFAQMLGIPDFKSVRRQTGLSAPLVARRELHGLDLSRWFTQPCVIVIGHLVQDGGDPPAPVTVNGQTFVSRGRTVVRWVYPLDPAPPAFVVDESAPAAGSAGPTP